MSTDSQRTKWRRNIAENFNPLSRAHERYRKTDNRRTDDNIIANVNVSSRSLKKRQSLTWNSLPNAVVDVDSVDLFRSILDNFWMSQDVKYDYAVNIAGNGNRSEYDIESHWKAVVVAQEWYGHRGSSEPASVNIIDLTWLDFAKPTTRQLRLRVWVTLPTSKIPTVALLLYEYAVRRLWPHDDLTLININITSVI